MFYLAQAVTEEPSVLDRVISIIGPILILTAFSLAPFQDKIGGELIKKDRYDGGRIALRPYFYITRLWAFGLFLAAFSVSIWYGGVAEAIFSLVMFVGFSVILFVLPCSVRLKYTTDTIYYQSRGKTATILMEDIRRMAWEDAPGAADYILNVYLESGKIIGLRSAHYKGLTNLRETYDAFRQDRKPSQTECDDGV